MGQAWNDLAEASKDEYTKQAKDLKTTYDKEYKNFLEGLSPESIKAIEAATGKKLRIPGGKKARSKELSRASGSPGKPLTAFFEFMRDFRAKEGGEGEGKEKVTAVAKRAGEKWNSMSEGEKQVSPGWAGLAKRPLGHQAPYSASAVTERAMLIGRNGKIKPLPTRLNTTNGTSLNISNRSLYRRTL
jgi:hypothetical protein